MAQQEPFLKCGQCCSSNANSLWLRVLLDANGNYHDISKTWLAHGFLSSSPPNRSNEVQRNAGSQRSILRSHATPCTRPCIRSVREVGSVAHQSAPFDRSRVP